MPSKVLLIPNVSPWILGDIAREITRHLGTEFEFSYLSELAAAVRPDLLRKLVAEADVIHCLTESATTTLFTHATPRCPVVTWIHHFTEWTGAHEFAATNSAHIVASTPEWAHALRDRVPAEVPVSVVPYGVDIERFRPLPRDRARFALKDDAFVVAVIGSKGSDEDGGRKGIDTAAAALRQAAATIPSLHAWFVGPGWEDAVEQFRAIGISASTTGYLAADALPHVYAALDAYLMSSRVEGGPCTVLEAMACGTPTVATAVGLVPAVITEGETGYIVAAGHSAGLADALVTVRNLDPSSRAGLAARARARVSAARQWGTTLQALVPVYESLATNARQASAHHGGGLRAQIDAVSAADALIWSTHAVVTRRMSASRGAQMLRAMLYGVPTTAVMRGLLLVASGAPSIIRRVLRRRNAGPR